MLIKRIKAVNYKTYLNLDLDLSVDPERPIILIGGKNGGGKTTLFEAICGALYGLKIKSKREFEQLLNDGAGKNSPEIILELLFTGQVLNQEQTYLLRRTYRLNPSGKPVESVYLNMNGAIFTYGTATAAAQRALNEQQVNKIIKANLPEELSSYFLFDAMQAGKLIEESVFAQIIRDNVENVMGFNKYLKLKRACDKLHREKSAERLAAEEERKEYAELCQKKEDFEAKLKENKINQDDAYDYITSMKAAYEKAKVGAENQETLRRQLEKLEGSIKETETNAARFVEDMKDFINTIETTTFMPKLASQLKVEIEQILRKKEELKQALESNYSHETILDIAQRVLDYLKQFNLCHPEVDVDNVTKHIELSQGSNGVEDEYSYLDDSDIQALQNLYRLNGTNNFTSLDFQRSSLTQNVKELPSLRSQCNSLRSNLTQGNESIIKQYDSQKSRLENLKADKIKLNDEIKKLDNIIHTYDVQIQQEPDVKYDTLVKLCPFFDDVANELLAAKKQEIEKEMCRLLNKLLLSYENCIERVELNDNLDDFNIKMYHKQGNEISLGQLNAASKQIFIQVLLKVLRNLGDYNPPVMIDTVMGVLDEESRDALMEEYFPQLAEQTILLCTTSEIRKDSDYIKLEPFISKTYTLIRDVEKQKTEVVNGYFGIELND